MSRWHLMPVEGRLGISPRADFNRREALPDPGMVCEVPLQLLALLSRNVSPRHNWGLSDAALNELGHAWQSGKVSYKDLWLNISRSQGHRGLVHTYTLCRNQISKLQMKLFSTYWSGLALTTAVTFGLGDASFKPASVVSKEWTLQKA